MKKYTEPKMDCRAFAAESVVTSSEAVKSSTELVQEDIQNAYGASISAGNTFTDTWNY